MMKENEDDNLPSSPKDQITQSALSTATLLKILVATNFASGELSFSLQFNFFFQQKW